MKRGADRVVWTAVGVSVLVTGLLAQRLPVYPLAVCLLLPLAAAISYLVIRTVARRTLPSRLRQPADAISVHLAMFMVALHLLVIANLAGMAWARVLGPRAVVVLLGAFLVTIGNLLPCVRPNLAIGIRTRQLLADPQRWSRMHRVAGYVVVAVGGAVGLAGICLSGAAIGAVVSICAVGSLTCLSFAYWRFTHD